MEESIIRTITEWERSGILDYIINESDYSIEDRDELLSIIKYNTIKNNDEQQQTRFNTAESRRNS